VEEVPHAVQDRLDSTLRTRRLIDMPVPLVVVPDRDR
jgi:hypothetical protein